MSDEVTKVEDPKPAAPEAPVLEPGTLLVRTDGNAWQAQYNIGRLALLQILRELHDQIATKPAQPAPTDPPALKIAPKE